MQFTATTRDYSRTINGKKETVKAVTSISLNVASHPEGKERKEEAEAREAAAGLIIAELAKAHGLEGMQTEIIRNLVELDGAAALSATESAALLRARDLLAYAAKLRTVTLTGSALNLALQGVGPNARFVTNALRKAVRGFLLLDNIDD